MRAGLKSWPESPLHYAMNTSSDALFRSFLIGAAVAFATVWSASAEPAKKNPASKLYVSDVAGEAQIDTG